MDDAAVIETTASSVHSASSALPPPMLGRTQARESTMPDIRMDRHRVRCYHLRPPNLLWVAPRMARRAPPPGMARDRPGNRPARHLRSDRPDTSDVCSTFAPTSASRQSHLGRVLAGAPFQQDGGSGPLSRELPTLNLWSLRPFRLTASIAVAAVAACDGPPLLTDDDRAAIRALDSTYVEAWLRDDTSAVMETLAPHAVLMPAGVQPLQGDSAIRRFWWPDDGSRTRVTRYTTTIDEIAGVPPMAYVRGTGELTFVYDKDTTHLEQTTRNMTLTVVSRQADGTWRIHRRMWGVLTP